MPDPIVAGFVVGLLMVAGLSYHEFRLRVVRLRGYGVQYGAVLVGYMVVNAAIFLPFYFVVEITDLPTRLSPEAPVGSRAPGCLSAR